MVTSQLYCTHDDTSSFQSTNKRAKYWVTQITNFLEQLQVLRILLVVQVLQVVQVLEFHDGSLLTGLLFPPTIPPLQNRWENWNWFHVPVPGTMGSILHRLLDHSGDITQVFPSHWLWCPPCCHVEASLEILVDVWGPVTHKVPGRWPSQDPGMCGVPWLVYIPQA